MLKEGSFINLKFRKLFFAFLLAWLVSLLGKMTDSLLAGVFLSEEAVEAIELVEPSRNIFMFFSLLVGYGGAVLYSQTLGKYEKEKAHKVAGNTLVYAAILSVIILILMIAIKNVFLDFYGCRDEIRQYCLDYYNINIIVGFISPLFWSLYELVCIDGDEVCVLSSDIVATGLNIILSTILVQFLGIKGLAIGTALSYLFAFIPLIIHLFKKNNSIHFKLNFNIRQIGEISYLGAIASLEYLFIAIVNVVMNRFIIVKFDESFLTSYTVVNFIFEAAVVTKTGIDAARSFVTIDYGQKNNIGIKRAMKKCLWATLPLTLVTIVIFLSLAYFWPVFFDIDEEGASNAAILAGLLIPCSFIVTSYLLDFSYYYGHIEKDLIGESIHILYYLVFPISLSLLLGNLIGFNGIIIAFTINPVLTALIVFLTLFIVKKGKNLPWLLPESDEDGKAYDIKLDDKSIIELRDQIAWLLASHLVDEKLSNKIQMMVEETLMIVKEKNKGKEIICECTVLFNENHVRLITKDNGVIFNIADSDNKVNSLQSYIVDEMINNTGKHISTTTISYNRNIFIWYRKSE